MAKATMLLILWMMPGFLSQTIQVSQVPVIYGTKGGSITLPCNYSLGGREKVTDGTYRWYKNGAKIGPEVSNNIPDYTGRISRADVNQFIEGRSAAITLHIVGPVDTGLYYCEVSFHTGGQVTGYGNGTFLNVTAGFLSQTIQVSQVPVIYGTKGGSVTLPCNYSLGGRENVTAGTYRWYKNVAKIGPEVSNNNPDYTGRISRADVNQFIEGRSATITQHIVGPVDTGLYYCEVSFQTGGQVSGYGNGTFLNVTAGTEEMGHTNNQTYFYVKVAGGILFVVFLGVLYGQVDKQELTHEKKSLLWEQRHSYGGQEVTFVPGHSNARALSMAVTPPHA
ncbi:uncharacterized protein [Hyperolius riggenbachi]|uniref:uncharacterized protein n=1 Tax=Hyperolius riggenbachi TaxID=752182 RepID=UPI0035A3CA5C